MMLQPLEQDFETFIKYNRTIELNVHGSVDSFDFIELLNYKIDGYSFIKVKSKTNDSEYILPLTLTYFKLKYEANIRDGINEFIDSNGNRTHIQYIIKPHFNKQNVYSFNVLKEGLDQSDIDSYFNFTNRLYSSVDDAFIKGWNDYVQHINNMSTMSRKAE